MLRGRFAAATRRRTTTSYRSRACTPRKLGARRGGAGAWGKSAARRRCAAHLKIRGGATARSSDTARPSLETTTRARSSPIRRCAPGVPRRAGGGRATASEALRSLRRAELAELRVMPNANLKPQTWLRRKLLSLRLRPWRLANSNRTAAALLCTTLTFCLLCRSKERVPEIVPSGGRNRPRLPWLRKRPARRAPLNVAAVASGTSCTHVATGAELAVDDRGVLCARAAPAHSPTEARHRPCPHC